MNPKQSERRRFLKDGAALAGLAVGAMRSASGQTLGSETPEARPKDRHLLGERSRFVKSERMVEAGFEENHLSTPLQDSVGIITPSALHYYQNHGYWPPPDIDPDQHRLLIHGMVDRPLILTVDELKRLPSVTRIHFLECGGNSSPHNIRYQDSVQMTHGLTSCSEWTGVLLSLLLREAGVQKGASWLVAEGAGDNKFSKSIPLAKAMDDVLVAYGQNGEAVRPEQGFPLRLLTPGWEGMANVKFLRRIKLVDQPYFDQNDIGASASLRMDGKQRWFQFEQGPISVITRPSGGQRLPGPGFFEITGLAWSGAGAVRRVEVSTDGGRTWKDSEIQGPVHRKAHTRFTLAWNWNGEETVLQSRCTDELGQFQPTLAEMSKFWGVNVDFWDSTKTNTHHFNVIQRWRVARDGSVHNAMFS